MVEDDACDSGLPLSIIAYDSVRPLSVLSAEPADPIVDVSARRFRAQEVATNTLLF